jgi:predicted lipid-binding transport protein (Tim44 family)
MPNGFTFMAMRPLIIPLALVSLGLGFVLWRFMGDIPSVLSMGLQMLSDGLQHGGRRPAPRAELTIAFPVDAGADAMRAVDPSFSATSFLAEVQRIGERVVAGWASRNLAECRILMTDICCNRQAAQLSRPVVDGWRQFARSVTLTAESIIAVRSEPGLYRINVRMHMACPPGTSKVIRGRRILEWVEDWSMIRPKVAAAGWLVDSMNHVAVHLERAA